MYLEKKGKIVPIIKGSKKLRWLAIIISGRGRLAKFSRPTILNEPVRRVAKNVKSQTTLSNMA